MNPTRTHGTAALVVSILLHVIFATSVVRAFATRPPTNAPVVEPRDRWHGSDEEVEVGVESTRPAAPPVESTPASRHSSAPPAEATAAGRRSSTAPVEPAPASRRLAAPRVLSTPAEGASSAGRDDATTEKRSLARAFARAFPVANTGDPIWNRLPIGDAGSIIVVLSIDGEGKMLDFEQREKPRAPPYLVRSVERALILLRGGHFALGDARALRQAFRLDVVLTDRAPESGPLALGYEAPQPGRSGRAYFQLPSGRFVDVKVSLAGS